MSPKQKNQSTSPNLPLSDTINEEEVSSSSCSHVEDGLHEILLQESVTPTSSIQPIMEEDVSMDSKKDELTSAAQTPPVQEMRFQANPYANTNAAAASATPTMPQTVLGYAPAAPYAAAPMESAGTIYHTGVSVKRSPIVR
jgi:hypothetical protein